MKYEMEIKFEVDHEYEVMYLTFNDLTKITEELEWLMNLETPLSYQLITSINIYKL